MYIQLNLNTFNIFLQCRCNSLLLLLPYSLSPTLSTSLAPSLAPSLSCSLSLSLAALSCHLPRPSHLVCLLWSFAFACHELPLGGTPWCTAILGLPSPPPASSLCLCFVSPQRTRLLHTEAPFGCLLIAAASLLTRMYLYL